MNKSRNIALFLTAALITSPAPVRAEHRAGTIVVRMLGDGNGFRFVPASVTAHVGDVIRFVNVSGGPHNVAFFADRIPAGTEATLQKNMGETDGPLTGAMISDPNAVYRVSLAGLRPGIYNYYCAPHQAMKMVGRIRVLSR